MSSSYVEVLVDVLQPRLAGASPARFHPPRHARTANVTDTTRKGVNHPGDS